MAYASAKLPTPHGEFTIKAYRFGQATRENEHCALIFGNPAGQEDVLVRVHSSCITGESFGSYKCDCQEQLQLAMKRIVSAGVGVIVYLVQEGRGIGLAEKIRAYAKQDAGEDTVEANLSLGHGADDRSYEMAAEILSDLDVRSVALMTNNPRKIEGLTKAGIPTKRIAHWVSSNEQSADYLRVKQEKLGHLPE